MDPTREQRIENIKRLLLRKSTPRLQVTLILFCSGLAGFLASFSLLHLDIFQMWLRYPIAILIAYGVFFVLLRVWLWVHGRQLKVNLDPPDFDYIPSGGSEPGAMTHFGGGGNFDGGGSGGSWGNSFSSSPARSTSSAVSDGIGFDLGDEGCFLVIAIIALTCGLLASLYVIYVAPALLAELLLDGVLMVGLYKRIKHNDQRHWIRAALRRTVVPALIVAICFTIAGFAMHKAVPEAHSIVEVWKQI
jgi:hypothetical protein